MDYLKKIKPWIEKKKFCLELDKTTINMIGIVGLLISILAFAVLLIFSKHIWFKVLSAPLILIGLIYLYNRFTFLFKSIGEYNDTTYRNGKMIPVNEKIIVFQIKPLNKYDRTHIIRVKPKYKSILSININVNTVYRVINSRTVYNSGVIYTKNFPMDPFSNVIRVCMSNDKTGNALFVDVEKNDIMLSKVESFSLCNPSDIFEQINKKVKLLNYENNN